MNVAIIGARRSKNGIGEYIANYFQRNGAQVVCVLGTTQKTASLACLALGKYGITARPYRDFGEMVSAEDLQAVVVSSPVETHYGFLRASLEKGLSVFCEKPFLDPAGDDVSEDLDEIFETARAAGATIAMNSQWPFCLASYEALCGAVVPSEVRRFSIRLSPVCTGAAMIPDSVPHALSILYAVLGEGTVSAQAFSGTDSEMTISFTYTAAYGGCEVSIALVHEERQPRTFWFGFNDRIARRSIDLPQYRIRLHFKDQSLPASDPLELCVRDFVQAYTRGRSPVIGRDHISVTTRLLKQIYDAYVMKERG